MSTPNWHNPRVAIVGSGAIGGYYGAKLVRAGYDVHFLLRRDYEHVRANGLQIRSHDGDFDLPHVQAYRSTHDIGPCDLVVITLKATNNQALLELLPPLLHPQAALLTLQNGLGNEEFLAEHFGAERVLGGVCFVCLTRRSPGVICNTGHGNIALGELNCPPLERTRAVARMFQQSGVPCEVSERLEETLWRKLVWNIPFNGLAIAAGQAHVANILEDAGLQRTARQLMAEIIAVAQRLGNTMPDGFLDFQIERSRIMGAYRPSSLIDYEAGREVEVEAIWGEPLRRGQAAGLDMPRLEMLYHLLKWLTEQNKGA